MESHQEGLLVAAEYIMTEKWEEERNIWRRTTEGAMARCGQ